MKRRNIFGISVVLLSVLSIGLSACGFAAPAAEESRGFVGEGAVFAEEEMVEAPEAAIASDVAAPREESAFSAGEQTAQAVERIVIKNADISIVVEDPAESMVAIGELAEEMGGFVVSSNLYQMRLESGDEVPSANITIRVPAERLAEALEEIEASANRVLSKNQSGQDVTREYTDLQSRLRNLEDAEAQLREIMASATKTEDVITVFNQLTSVREQIEVTKGQIQYYEQSAALSAISITLTADAALQPLTIGGWQPVGVAKDAIQALINSLQGLTNVAIWLVLYLLPVAVVIGVPVALIWRGVKNWRARRKGKASAPKDKN